MILYEAYLANLIKNSDSQRNIAIYLAYMPSVVGRKMHKMRNSIPNIVLQRTDSKTNTERTEEENNHSHSSRPFTYSRTKDRSQRNIPHAATMKRGQEKESRVPKLGPDSRNALYAPTPGPIQRSF